MYVNQTFDSFVCDNYLSMPLMRETNVALHTHIFTEAQSACNESKAHKLSIRKWMLDIEREREVSLNALCVRANMIEKSEWDTVEKFNASRIIKMEHMM